MRRIVALAVLIWLTVAIGAAPAISGAAPGTPQQQRRPRPPLQHELSRKVAEAACLCVPARRQAPTPPVLPRKVAEAAPTPPVLSRKVAEAAPTPPGTAKLVRQAWQPDLLLTLPSSGRSEGPSEKAQPAWTPADNLSNTPALSRVPELAVTATGTAHVVWEEESSIYHASGTSGAWSAPAEAAVGDSPSLAVDSTGTVHMAYLSDIGGVFDVFYTRWDGTDWSLPTNVSGTSGTSSAPAMAISSEDLLHVIWADNTGGESALYHGQSTDGSAWSTFPIPNGAGTAPAVAVDIDDVLHVAWQSSDPETGFDEIWHMQFTRGTWSLPESISATPDADSTGPTIAAAPDNTLHIVWQEELGANAAIYHSSGRSGDWSRADDVSGTLEKAEFPALDINRAGQGFLVWDEGNTIVGRGLDALTGTWSEREEVAGSTSGISDPVAFLDEDTIHVAWAQAISNFNWDIFYRARSVEFVPTHKLHLPLISRR